MNKFFAKHAATIFFMFVSLLTGIVGTTGFDKMIPDPSMISKEIMKDLIIDAFKDPEVKETMVGIMHDENKEFSNKLDVLYYDSADNWVRSIDKQYGKLESNASNLYWIDVEYILSKWSMMPEDYKTPSLISKMTFIQMKYDEHIGNGG